jgi:hypothetical protein
MCDLIVVASQCVEICGTFLPQERVLVRTDRISGRGIVATKSIYWDGWAREEATDEWLKSGHWKRADVLADSFSVNTRSGRREYELPPHHAIKSIILETPDRMVMRVLTREPVGAEARVCKRFAKTGKISVMEVLSCASS